MAFTASAVLEVQTGGSDTLGTGVFDPGVGGMDATASIASANTSAPVVTVNGEAAGDVNMWFFLKSGTGSVPGWYPITAVDTVNHKYTLNAAIGAAVLTNYTLNTAVGCGTSASLTSQTWAVDFSQATTQIATGTATSATTTLTATTAIFRKPMVGNGVTNGTAWRVITAYTSTTIVTIDASPTWAAQTVTIGGALASPGQAGAIAVASNYIWAKSGTYSITSTTNNVAGGRITPPNSCFLGGYGTIRGDGGTAPVFQASGIATATLVTCGGMTTNIKVDGASLTAIRGIDTSGNNVVIYNCTAINCTNSGFNSTTSGKPVFRCYASGCSVAAAFNGGQYFLCVADSNTAGGFSLPNNGGISAAFCIASNNTGIGFQLSNLGVAINCTSYNNTSDGFKSPVSPQNTQIINCLSAKNGGWQINLSGTLSSPYWAVVSNCAMWNSGGSGTLNGTNAQFALNNVTLTSDPFINAAGGNFALTPAAIALIGSQGIPGAFPGLASTTGFLAIGAVQPTAVRMLYAGDICE